MIAALTRQLRALARDRTGASAMELLLITPVIGGMIFGAVDFGLAFTQKLALEQAAGRTAELVTAPGTVALSYANLPAEAKTAYGKSSATSTVDNWLECNGTRQSSFTGSCPITQQTARYVSIVISDDYVPIASWGGLIHGSGQKNGFRLTGDATVRVQ